MNDIHQTILSLKKDMSSASLLAQASAQTCLDDFGDTSFLPALERSLQITQDANLSVQGLTVFRINFVRYLENRLRYQADIAKYPEILDEDVSDPIVVLGLPRTGTTKLQRMLSADPGVQSTSTWRMFNPAPFPGEGRGGSALRVEWAGAVAAASAAADTDMARIHEFSASEPEEDGFLTVGSFDYFMQYIISPEPTYLEWVRQVPRTRPLTYLKKMLQYLQWQDGGKNGRPWLLKNPGHLGNIRELLDIFPQATFVMSERNLSVTMGSYCQMMFEMYQQFFLEVDRKEHGRSCLDFWAYEMKQYVEARQVLGGKLRIVSAPYTRLLNDCVGIAREAYALHGKQLTEEGRTAMLDWEQANQQNKHGKFEYSLGDFALTEQIVDDAFGPIAAEWRDYR